jgi:hypothetical protein
MAQLEDLDKDQDHHDVHHGCVKLQADVGGAHVEDNTEEALYKQAFIK